MSVLFWILSSTFIISIISLIGILVFFLREKLLEKVTLILVALSAGALLGGAFLHLIPESLEKFADDIIFLYILIGFIFFFFIEKILHWRHCHKGKCDIHTFAYMNLLGDFVHNFIDGLIIAASYTVSIPLGITTTLAVALHEIPQEIGDFGVLVYGGFKRLTALLINFTFALTAVLGGLTGYFLSSYAESSIMFLIPFAAGGFIYISASDLIPEIRKEVSQIGPKRALLNFITFVIGILIMYSITFVIG